MDLALLLGKRAAIGVVAVLLATGLAACGGEDSEEAGDAPAAAAPGSGSTPGSSSNPNPAPTEDLPPVISGTPIKQVAVGHPYSFTPTAFDANGDAMGFSAVNVPSWATFSPVTGRISGTPQAQHVGNFNLITISVTANGRTSSLAPYNIQVINPPVNDGPPVISGTPSTQVVAGSAYSFTPTASDPNSDALSFTIVNQPAWATFNTSTGALTGTPQTAHVGTYGSVTISVTANGRTVSLAPFSIQVLNVQSSDAPPVISGAPITQVLVGSAYSFTPTASDPNGDALSFSVVNLPSWASFNPSTGRLSGTPQIQHVGSYGGITIRVTANGKTASLPAFNIQVVGVGSESVTLTWLPPTQNEDGSALTDLAGYKIRYGLAPGSYTQTVTVPNPGLASWQIDNLVKATYYFVISAYNSNGIESRYSNEASKSL